MGGRDGDYRGYSYKKNLQAGRWRVGVETKKELLLGRIGFTVKNVKRDSLSTTVYKLSLITLSKFNEGRFPA